MSTESLLHHLARQLKRNIHSFSQAGLTARWRPLKQKKKSNYRCQRSACSFVLTELLENKILRAASALRKGSLFFAKLPVWLSFWSVWPLTLKKKKKDNPQKCPKHNPLTDKTLLSSQLQYKTSGTNMTSPETFMTLSVLRYILKLSTQEK